MQAQYRELMAIAEEITPTERNAYIAYVAALWMEDNDCQILFAKVKERLKNVSVLTEDNINDACFSVSMQSIVVTIHELRQMSIEALTSLYHSISGRGWKYYKPTKKELVNKIIEHAKKVECADAAKVKCKECPNDCADWVYNPDCLS